LLLHYEALRLHSGAGDRIYPHLPPRQRHRPAADVPEDQRAGAVAARRRLPRPTKGACATRRLSRLERVWQRSCTPYSVLSLHTFLVPFHLLVLQAKAADAKQPSGKKRSVIDITATAMQIPERPGPLPGAIASPLQVRPMSRSFHAYSAGSTSGLPKSLLVATGQPDCRMHG
jgi:hypothetical protein